MSKPSLDPTIARCLCFHPDKLLIPILSSTLEANGISVSLTDKIPTNLNWSENVSHLIWVGASPIDSHEINVLINEVIEKKSKLLCLIPLDTWHATPGERSQRYKEIADTITKIKEISGGKGDIRIIGYAGIWANTKIDTSLIIGQLCERLRQGKFSLSASQVIYPLAAGTAVEAIVSRWFDRGHRSKSMLISGPPISGEDIKNKIDISNLNKDAAPIYWGREEGITFSENFEIPSDISMFIAYLSKHIKTNPFLPPPTPPKTVILPPLPPPPLPVNKVIQPKKRGASSSKRKTLITTTLVSLFLLLLLNLPNLYLLANILLVGRVTVNTKESVISTRYQQITRAIEQVANIPPKLPLIGVVGDQLIGWANQARDRLSILKIQTLLIRTAKHMVSAEPGDPYKTLQEAKYVLDEVYVRQSIQKNNAIDLEWVSQTRKAVELLPQLIPSDKKITVLLLLQNNLELRPTGGFIGAVGLLSFDHGKLLTIDTRDIYDLDSNLKGQVSPPTELKTYLGESSWYFRDSNWSPNFVESAASANWFLEKEWGSPADVVIGINLNTLKTILAATGPITLPDDTIVESNNLLVSAFNHQDVPTANPTAQKQEFLSQLIKPIVDSLIQADPEKALRLLLSFGGGVNDGECTITSNQPSVLSELTEAGWSGSTKPPICSLTFPEPCIVDTFGLNEANVGINKTNFYLTRTIDHSVRLYPNVAEHIHRVSYVNHSPNDTWPGGSYKAFIRVIIPLGATGLTVTADNQPINLTYSAPIPGFFLEVKPQAGTSLTISYSVPLKKSYQSYELNLIKQPGAGSDPLTVSIEPPSSQSLKTLTPHLFPDSVLKYSGLLSKNFSAAFSLIP